MEERRHNPDRRVRQRRQHPSESIDVTRLEHENLFRQVEELLRMLRRVEHELIAQSQRLRSVERDIVALGLNHAKGA